MLNNSKEVKESRLSNIKEKDFQFFMTQTGLSRLEINRIFKIFNDKGGVLNRVQFKDVFEELTRYWLGQYKNTQEISDLMFRAFDKDRDSILELNEFLEGSAILFLAKGDKKTKLEYIFDLYDVNHDGSLTLKEIKEGFQALFSLIGSESSDLLCKQMAESTMNEMGFTTEDPNTKKESIASNTKNSRKSSFVGTQNAKKLSTTPVPSTYNPKISKDIDSEKKFKKKKMLKNFKPVNRSRLDSMTEEDFMFYMAQTGLSREEVDHIVKIFDDKGGVLTRLQFKQVFHSLNKNWLGIYENCSEISDFVFRAFDRNHDSVLELREFMQGCSILFLSKGDQKSKLEYIFCLYDANNDGYLSFNEVKEGYKALFYMLGNENSEIISTQMAEATVNDMGVGSNLKIKKDDFIEIILQNEQVNEKLSMLFT